jgi:hypothetical protein
MVLLRTDKVPLAVRETVEGAADRLSDKLDVSAKDGVRSVRDRVRVTFFETLDDDEWLTENDVESDHITEPDAEPDVVEDLR